MIENKVGSKKRGNRGMRAIVHMHDDSHAAMKAFSEKRAAMAIGYVRDCSAAEIKCLRHELYKEMVSA
ncbi:MULTISPECIES: hypothetical protein [unclassified Clostridium]|uniref:hypothetical protein n=1 Tax=unclassified Clostridium TaxID=2614128 RepID=UPI0011057D2F|nr:MULTISPECIES: hypothetical protein [unclassified Clostridium]MBY1896630.1 hypothetical protein [Clostridioides difficile]